MGMEKHRPALFELNTRVFLQEKNTREKAKKGFDAIEDSFLKDLQKKGIDFLWLLGVWKTGPAGRQVSQSNPAWQDSFKKALPDVDQEDITGSPFAIRSYQVDPVLGGARSLARLRQRAKALGLGICLDFVPNHTAMDHPWVKEKPHFYIQGTQADLDSSPENFISLKTKEGPKIFAHGKDPYFPGWADTLQLNYHNKEFRQAMKGELVRIAKSCDALRCDMAMLVLPEVFDKTWSKPAGAKNSQVVSGDFWPEAIRLAKKANPPILFIAEAYWNMEWKLLSQGFDFAYDKKLYDRLVHGDCNGVRLHLGADWDYNCKMVRFLENHDEPRALEAFGFDKEKAAAIISYFSPGLLFFHEGQWDGRKVQTSIHLNRRQKEKPVKEVQAFYLKLLKALALPNLRAGMWQLGAPAPVWEGNATWGQITAMFRQGTEGEIYLAAVNYGASQGQCRLTCPFPTLEGKNWNLRDLLGGPSFVRGGDEMASQGLFIDLPPWGCHLFAFEPQT